MNAPKTLTEAKEQLETAQTRIAQLETVVGNHDAILASFGIVSAVGADGVTHYESPRLAEAEAKLAEAKTANKAHAETHDSLTQQLTARDGMISAQATEISDLKAKAQTVEARAREMLALQGGPPLAIDNGNPFELTTIDGLRAQLATEKEPEKVFEIYKRIKALQAQK